MQARQISGEPGTGLVQPVEKKDKSGFIPAMANFNIQYNFTSASIAKSVMTDTSYLTLLAGGPLYPIPEWADKALQAIVFIGAMLGMLFMGRLGDVLGRMRAMQVTLLLAALGAVIPMCAVGSPNGVYFLVCLGRLILGVGVGGIYPLSAVSAAEGTGKSEKKGKNVSQAFFWQTPGCIAPYLVAMLLFKWIDPQPPVEWVPQFEFRFLFGAGVIPGAIVFFSSLQDNTEQGQHHRPEKGLFATLAGFPTEIKQTLAGTGGAWFFYDISYYGISIFTPSILSAICLSGEKTEDGGCDQNLFDTAWQAVITNSFGIPAVIIAIMLIEKWGSKRLNVYGFILIAVCCLAFAVVYAVDPHNTGLLFGLYCVLTFSLNFGPNIGTYVLPAICFPGYCRSTCHGFSATCGKLGAVVGTVAFGFLNNGDSLWVVFVINFVVAILGAIFSQVCLRHDWEYLDEEDRKATMSFMQGPSTDNLPPPPM